MQVKSPIVEPCLCVSVELEFELDTETEIEIEPETQKQKQTQTRASLIEPKISNPNNIAKERASLTEYLSSSVGSRVFETRE